MQRALLTGMVVREFASMTLAALAVVLALLL